MAEKDEFNVWNGVYSSAEEALKKGTGFSSERWANHISDQLKNYKKASCNSKLTMPPRPSDLPLLVALTGAKNIIDFGGSNGWAYQFLKNSLHFRCIERYLIIEIPEIVERSGEFFHHYESVCYLSQFDNNQIPENIEIMYTNSVLQYIFDSSFHDYVQSCRPNYILIEDFMGGDFDDWFSIQSYYESKIPVIFRNRKKFLKLFDGYELILSKPYAAMINGRISELPMENFPVDKRVRYAESLLLQKVR